MSGDIVHDQATDDLSTWGIERLEAHAAVLGHGQWALEAIRELAQSRVYQAGEERHARLRWAKLSLAANRRFHDEFPWHRARMLDQDFMLRTWVIEHLGPDEADADWDPEALAADTLAALSLDPEQAASRSASWRTLPAEQIGELRRHKNLTRHLGRLIGFLHPGPVKDQLTGWQEIRGRLP